MLMNLSFFKNLFKTPKKTLDLPDSLLLKKLKSLEEKTKIYLYDNITIYHHSKSFFIPLIILDEYRGIFLFEHKDWSYDELKDATLSQSSKLDSSSQTIAYENAQNFIKRKFNELTHHDGVAIHNFVLMENLDSDDYDKLDSSFKDLLPKDRVIFTNNSSDEMLEKLEKLEKSVDKLANVRDVISNLLIQYGLLDANDNVVLATKEQRKFIDAKITSFTTLYAPFASGKTSTILLKAILEKLRDDKIKIIIVEPTLLACDKLKQKLINTVERAIISIDITDIEIITPIELLNRHLKKLKKPELYDKLYVDKSLMSKHIDLADLIICDDVDLIDNSFISYLEHIQKKSSLLLVKCFNENSLNINSFKFSENFRENGREVLFKQANKYAKTMQIITSLLKDNQAKDILVVSGEKTKKDLSEDLEHFINDKAILFNSSTNLLYQEFGGMLLATYKQISGLEAKYVILLDADIALFSEIEYALNLSTEKTYIVFDDEIENIVRLKDKYEVK